MAPARPTPPPGTLAALPWCHPKRLLEDAVAVAFLLVIALMFAASHVSVVARSVHTYLSSTPVQQAARTLLAPLSLLRRRRLGGSAEDTVPLVPSSSSEEAEAEALEDEEAEAEEEEEEAEEEAKDEDEEGWRHASDVPRGVRGTVTLPIQATGWPAAPGKGPSQLTSTTVVRRKDKKQKQKKKRACGTGSSSSSSSSSSTYELEEEVVAEVAAETERKREEQGREGEERDDDANNPPTPTTTNNPTNATPAAAAAAAATFEMHFESYPAAVGLSKVNPIDP
jgi:hypothetical protein